MHRSIVTTITTAALLGLVGVSTDAADPTDKCHSGKLKKSAKYGSCRLKAESKAILTTTAPDFAKCTAKFLSKFNHQETKAGPGICVTEGDGTSINDWLTRDTDDIATLLGGGVTSRVPQTGQTTSYGAGDDGDAQPGVALQYTDNGDGTITDRATGLMWEKKILGTGGYTPCNDETGTCANPHNADNVYAWTVVTSPYEAYDGKVVTIFLEQLNDRCDQDTTMPCIVDADCSVPGGECGFAGHRDWRLPTIKELQSIVDYSKSYPGPTVNATFHGGSCGLACTDITSPACSCTTSQYYWSSTTFADYPTYAWFVYFKYGDVYSSDKYNPFYVRAVRGGS